MENTPYAAGETAAYNWQTRTLTIGQRRVVFTPTYGTISLRLAQAYPKAVPHRKLHPKYPPVTDNAACVAIFRVRQSLNEAGMLGQIDIIVTYGYGRRLSAPVHIEVDVAPPTEVLPKRTVAALRLLLRRCADRPADAYLAEQVRLGLEASL